MADHAPTPWTVRDAPGAGWQITAPISGRIEVIDYPHPQPRETYFWDLTDVQFVLISGERWVQFETKAWKEMQAANAAFIVRACNSHDALVAALDEARAMIVKQHTALGAAYPWMQSSDNEILTPEMCDDLEHAVTQVELAIDGNYELSMTTVNAALKLAREAQPNG